VRFLVFQHVAVEHPGAFRDLWRRAGIVWDTVAFDRGDAIRPLDRYDALVVLGGPMDVWEEAEHPWLVAEKRAIRRWVAELGRPFLGICLGHQLLADALGGRVGRARLPEVGLSEVTLTAEGRNDPLFAGFHDGMDVFQWHAAEVTAVPATARVLASSAACAVQALRFGRAAYGIQYHVELTAATVREWRCLPAYAASLESALGADAAERLEDEVAQRLPQFMEAAERLTANFLAVASSCAVHHPVSF
jgi:GMP synthase-like glutamine amidotransferase